jgi:trk system potassium uptake protein TrkA/voltage-gated potassium channel
MTGLLDSPTRNLTFGIIYVVLVSALGTFAYMKVGHWSFRDSVYMVITTVYTVGYGEVRPIDTPALNIITLSPIVLGCTGIIFLTGSLEQYITVSQLTKVMGLKRMKAQIDELSDHVIVCGFGRTGSVLAQALSQNRAGFVVLEQQEARADATREAGFLCIHGDAASEAVLYAAGVMRARVLVTALTADADNVFITLSARALNSKLAICSADRSTRRAREPWAGSSAIARRVTAALPRRSIPIAASRVRPECSRDPPTVLLRAAGFP